MVFNGENDWIGRSYKGTAIDGFDHRSKGNLGGEGVAVVDERGAVVTVPAVQLDAAAACQQDLAVQLYRAFALELMSCQVGVVGARDVVMRQRLLHVTFVGRHTLTHESVVVLIHKIPSEAFERQAILVP